MQHRSTPFFLWQRARECGEGIKAEVEMPVGKVFQLVAESTIRYQQLGRCRHALLLCVPPDQSAASCNHPSARCSCTYRC